MNENVDLIKILKNCPRGFKLYSAVHGEVTFLSIEDRKYPIGVLLKNDDCKRKYYPFRCVGNGYLYCIPYNNDTKRLVGTTDEAPEYYRYWED